MIYLKHSKEKVIQMRQMIFLWLSICLVNVAFASKQDDVESLCSKLAQKLSSVSYEECRTFDYDIYKIRSVRNHPLLMKEIKSTVKETVPKILFIGGIHGDEYSSVSATFKWLKILKEHHSGKYHWLFLPLVNPDGLLRKVSQRMNDRDIDLNRNFPPEGQASSSLKYWRTKAGKDPRKYPGKTPASEPETKAIMEIIKSFKPDVIVSVHAPYDLLDFDGEAFAPEKFGPLELKLLGTYPGSLGNYAWLRLNIPVITIELPNANVMPVDAEISDIWKDFVRWLKYDQPKIQQVQRVAVNQEDTRNSGIR